MVCFPKFKLFQIFFKLILNVEGALLVCHCCQSFARQARWLEDKSLLARWTLSCYYCWHLNIMLSLIKVDCTLHGRLCQQHGVRAYPTTVFFNGSRWDGLCWYFWWHLLRYDDADAGFRPHKYEGGHHAQDLADFVEDILRPVVVPLTVRDDSFFFLPPLWHLKLHRLYLPTGKEFPPESWCKGRGGDLAGGLLCTLVRLMWTFGDFETDKKKKINDRCGPCQELAPEWRALAKLTQSLPFVHVGKVKVVIVNIMMKIAEDDHHYFDVCFSLTRLDCLLVGESHICPSQGCFHGR